MDPRDKDMIARKVDRVADRYSMMAHREMVTETEAHVYTSIAAAFTQLAMDLREELNNARQAQRQRAADQ
jgi:hypothetical protein